MAIEDVWPHALRARIWLHAAGQDLQPNVRHAIELIGNDRGHAQRLLRGAEVALVRLVLFANQKQPQARGDFLHSLRQVFFDDADRVGDRVAPAPRLHLSRAGVAVVELHAGNQLGPFRALSVFAHRVDVANLPPTEKILGRRVPRVVQQQIWGRLLVERDLIPDPARRVERVPAVPPLLVRFRAAVDDPFNIEFVRRQQEVDHRAAVVGLAVSGDDDTWHACTRPIASCPTTRHAAQSEDQSREVSRRDERNQTACARKRVPEAVRNTACVYGHGSCG